MKKHLNSQESNKVFSASSVLFFILLLYSFFVFVPLIIHFPQLGLDPSWKYGMNYAIANNFILGKDIIFTFGPLSPLYTSVYTPEVSFLFLNIVLFLCFALQLLYIYQNFSKKIAFTVVILHVTLPLYLVDSIFYIFIILSYSILHLLLKKKNLFANIFTFFIAFCLGMLCLVKGSFIIICVGTIGSSSILFLCHKNYKPVFSLVLGFIGTIISLWLYSGQELVHLPSWILSNLPIISGYTEAMSINGKTRDIIFVLIPMIVTLFALIKEDKPVFEKAIITFTFFCYFLLIFKAGFVRQDGHIMITMLALIPICILLNIFTTNKKYYLSIILLASLPYIISAWDTLPNTILNIPANISHKITASIHGLQARVDGSINDMYYEHIERLNEQVDLPLLEGTSDIYPFDITNLLVSGNTWNPRPIFQSYSAYTPNLIEKNVAHLLSENAPDNIFFKIQPIDGRFPSLADGASWPTLFDSYDFVEKIGEFILLEQRETPITSSLDALVDLQASISEDIALPTGNNPLYIKLNIEPTLLGKFTNIVYKLPEVFITVTLANSTQQTHRIIPSMAETGFFISPLISNTNDFLLMQTRNYAFLAHKKIVSFRVEANSTFWNSEYTIEISAYNNPAPPALFIDHQGTRSVENYSNRDCTGSLDQANISSQGVAFSGWLIDSLENGTIANNIFAVTRNSDGNNTWYNLNRFDRNDVANHLQNENLSNSGFSGTLFQEDVVSLNLGFETDSEVFLCNNLRVEVAQSIPNPVFSERECVGNIDNVTFTDNSVSIRGWLIDSLENKSLPNEVFAIIRDGEESDIWYYLDNVARLDVGTHFSSPEFNNSGFEGNISHTNPNQIRLGMQVEGNYYTCSNLSQDENLNH